MCLFIRRKRSNERIFFITKELDLQEKCQKPLPLFVTPYWWIGIFHVVLVPMYWRQMSIEADILDVLFCSSPPYNSPVFDILVRIASAQCCSTFQIWSCFGMNHSHLRQFPRQRLRKLGEIYRERKRLKHPLFL